MVDDVRGPSLITEWNAQQHNEARNAANDLSVKSFCF